MSVVNTMDSKRVTDEVRHANDDLEHFYLEARRNKKLANWAAKKLNIDKKEYFMELVSADLSCGGPKPVVDRIMVDFAKAKIDCAEDVVWKHLRDCEKEVFHEMLADRVKRTQDEMALAQKKKSKIDHKKAP
ncbi:MAG: DUF1476 family protein [Methylocystaceae bacterium]|nr:DUF1476 family protein [Methylocystaceae bacterium]